MAREIIQIAVTREGHIVALCSDNTIWLKTNDWVQVKSLPGTEEVQDEQTPESTD